MNPDFPNRIVAIVLAAGRSTRMGEANKLLQPWQGKPLALHVLDAAKAVFKASDVIVVTGHQADKVKPALGTGVTTVHNPDFATGMASSLKVGLEQAVGLNADAALILLGDMPIVNANHIEAMLEARLAARLSASTAADFGSDVIVQATSNGKPGNPVLLPRSLFGELMLISGDRGARSIIDAHCGQIVSVELGTAAAKDFDTPEAFVQKGL